MGRRILNLLFLAMVAASLPADAVGEACPTSFLVDHSHPICLSQIPHSQSAEEASHGPLKASSHEFPACVGPVLSPTMGAALAGPRLADSAPLSGDSLQSRSIRWNA
jgi:hypothetical protein